MPTPLSILDLAFVSPAESPREALAATVTLAQRAEALGYRRVWYAEHHNMAAIASSAPAVLIAHVAAHTRSIRLGAGGVMLPNHAPLTIAEQFGTLEALHPGRIDLALGRAPGTDPVTTRALRVPPQAFDAFPTDVLELEGYLGDATRVPGVEATPGKGTRVPLTILGSSLFGARLAAKLGLPYGFASHFAPDLLEDAVALYRREFQPARGLDAPYVLAGVNVLAADTVAEAEAQRAAVLRFRVKALLGRGAALSDAEADALLATPAGARIRAMGTYTALGTGPDVAAYLARFAAKADADELVTVHPAPTLAARLRSIELTAEHAGLVPPAS